jgi:hypothetical protein
MRKLLWAGLLVRGTMPLTACIQVQSGAPPLVVIAGGQGEGCRVTVNGERVTGDQLLALGRRAPGRRGIVLYDKDTPYKCTGAAIITLQRAGLTSVDSAMWDDR